MPRRKDITKEEVLLAMRVTKSVRAAARYINCSYTHMKKWMKFYKNPETGKSLFEEHKNPHGKGIPKFLTQGGTYKKEPPILDLIEGRLDASSWLPARIKFRIIEAGLVEERCYKCGFCDRRVIDYRMPLILNHKDGNKQHWALKNLEMLCYNCYFMEGFNVLTERDLNQLEDHKFIQKTSDAVDFELDPYHMQRLKEIGLIEDDKDDPYDLVSRPAIK